ncbi:MAG: hypothetical protein A2169_04250 [Deltaproteobacteria bacterium RBG_13_47_9]|nr:MAG: hypothetical protein A2169_04250 [Deltaproteobacteria bacterium RBG_13_47_9]
MNENFEEYRELVKLIRAAPKRSASDGFTEKVMNRLVKPKLEFWTMIKRAMRGSGEITASGFRREYSAENQTCFNFLMAGLFFFIIGTILLSSLFYSPAIMVSLLTQAILIFMAAFSLVAAGLMLVARVPDASHWAKRALMVYGILITANAFLIQANSKMALGEVFALTFGITGILMGMILMRALKIEANETTAS